MKSGAAPPSLTAVGAKKPLSSLKTSPNSSDTQTVVTKKSPTKTTTKKATTTITTTIQKKVVNGDVITEQSTTTQTTSGDPKLIEDILKDGLASESNGHDKGNGIAENGSGEGAHQMVLDSSAD